MSIRLYQLSEISPNERKQLERLMADFYQNPPASYYALADRASEHYTRDLQPFHCDLVERVRPNSTVLELGCGTAHLCRFVEERGGHYTGLDYGDELLAANRQKFTNARFLRIDEEPGKQFDLVASLYTIEHTVDPVAYLERMWALCKSGGLLAVICPEFIDNDALPPSLFYGKTARRLREKFCSLSLVDAALHAIDVKWSAPRWKMAAQRASPGAFWINMKPRALHGVEYSTDADAVHQTRLTDITDWFGKRGAQVIASSQTLSNIPPTVLRYNCYALARKG